MAEELPYLESDPPHWVARALSRLIIGLTVVAVLAAVLVKVPETVTGRFVLVPVHGTDPVRTLREGVVREVRARESDSVAKGAPLFVLRAMGGYERTGERRTLERQVAASNDRITLLMAEERARRRADSAEMKRLQERAVYLERQVASKSRRLALLREIADSSMAGAQRGALARFEANRLEYDARTLAEEVEAAGHDLAEVRADITRLEREAGMRALNYEQEKRQVIESAETQSIRLGSLAGDLVNDTDSGTVLMAPCDGTVLRLRVNGAGAVVQPGEVLAELACNGSELQAELILPQAGVPLVQPGQGVKLKFDAFPYQRYGVRYGSVKWLGPAGAGAPDSAAFRALVAMPENAVQVRGRKRPLLPGMGGQADIVVGRRSLISFAFEPLRALRESFVEAPKS